MIEFAYPWLFLLLPLPLLVYTFAPEYKEPTDSLRVPFFARLVSLTGQTPADGVTVEQRMWFQKIWLAVAWVLLIVAMAKPELVGEPQTQNKSARDLMVAVDLSGSMEVQDFSTETGENVDRLTAVKSVLSEFREFLLHYTLRDDFCVQLVLVSVTLPHIDNILGTNDKCVDIKIFFEYFGQGGDFFQVGADVRGEVGADVR